MSNIDLAFLEQGAAAQPARIAHDLARFVAGANASLHLAIYDFRLSRPELQTPVIGALKERAAAGIDVKIACDQGKPAAASAAEFTVALGGDPAPQGTLEFLQQQFQGTSVEIKGIVSSKLMHSKYVVADSTSAAARLWTGSANFTDDAWTLQENNVLRIASADLCALYERDFGELWKAGTINNTGGDAAGQAVVDGAHISVAFSPGGGAHIEAMIADAIASARRRIRLSSMILSSHVILGALSDAIHGSVAIDFAGIYDRTQMDGVVLEWKKSSHNDGLIATFEEVASHLAGKKSTPYRQDSPHDFMHNKVVVCDDVVITGSFNFSHSATQNAENCLFISDARLAQRYSVYIDKLVTRYSAVGAPRVAPA